MIKKIFVIMLITLILTALFQEPVQAEKDEKSFKDSDKDGIPDYLDNEKIEKYNSSSNSTKTLQRLSSTSFLGGNWTITYGSDTTYGAYIEEIEWNSTKYINIANVPWVKIDGVKYDIPNDFTFHGMGLTNNTEYYLVYQLYSKMIINVNHTIEVLWYFWKESYNNAGRLDVNILHSTYNNMIYQIDTFVRFDFDIIDPQDDYFEVYGAEGWQIQSSEAFQFTGSPVEQTWGIKLKQLDYSDSSIWAGINAWSTSEKNYLLQYNYNEFKGNPNDYLDHQDVFREDDVIISTVGALGKSPISCGPTAFLH